MIVSTTRRNRAGMFCRHGSAALASAVIALLSLDASAAQAQDVPVWERFEASFTSLRDYDNPLYDIARFAVHFTSPTGRKKKTSAFWDGGRTWKVRFMPDEPGAWSYVTEVKAADAAGLQDVRGTFRAVTDRTTKLDIHRRGAIRHPEGSYHLAHADGTPFFWAACTAWNGALKSTDDEWERYLSDRVRNGYSVIQLVATQWRGQDLDEKGDVAFEGTGRIRIHPAFFQRLDRKMDRINAHGLIAAPVLLWALQQSTNRELSPGDYLPEPEAILLARYMVARYGAHHVVWLLGGDGRYNNEYEQRWKNIGRGVFGSADFQGVVALHSMGKSWIGREYAGESWLDVLGYQSGHNAESATVEWITKGPVVEDWAHLPPRPLINMEPAYEQSGRGAITAQHVRNASYWSVFAAPVAGITYGANAIWPWSRSADEPVFGHGNRPAGMTWEQSLKLPGSVQIGYLAGFIRRFEWWALRPAHQLVLDQPGVREPKFHVSVLRDDGGRLLLVYLPATLTVRLANPLGASYKAEWFDPATSAMKDGAVLAPDPVLQVASPFREDAVLILRRR
jgi:Protein of unknown function (DUF4038)/Domain of unknown function (DUF5060)